MIWAAFLCLLPTAIELYSDRNGESRKNKPRQLIILTVVSLALAFIIQWSFDIELLRSVALMFGIHTLIFDYAINYILYRRKVIQSPEARHWFVYMGKTSTWDKYVSRVNPWLRLLIRVIVFGASVAIFIS